MPGRYRLDAAADRIAVALGADAGRDVWQGGAIVAGGFAPVVVRGKDNARRLVPRLWGVPPPAGTHVVTHVRNLHSPFWIGTLRHPELRCLIPVTAFCGGSNGRNSAGRATWFAVPGHAVFAFAGIWRDCEVPSFAMVTVAGDGLYPTEQLQTLPVILRPGDYGTWLSADWKQAQDLVKPPPLTLRPIDQS